MITNLVLRPSKNCYGVYTTQSWKKGDKIHQYAGDIVPTYMAAKGERSLTIDRHFSLEWRAAGAQCYFNHSCNPNSYLEWIDGMPYLTAIRDISYNEEICYNYNTVELNLLKASFLCNCGDDKCIGWIRGFLYLTPRQELDILDMLSPYLKEVRKEYEQNRD